jgi:hypothetical protein
MPAKKPNATKHMKGKPKAAAKAMKPTKPAVRAAIKWGSLFYGVPGQGWFAANRGFTKHVKFHFFAGTSLEPVPPAGRTEYGRPLDLRESDRFDELLGALLVSRSSR